jgi:hypothetical protein
MNIQFENWSLWREVSKSTSSRILSRGSSKRSSQNYKTNTNFFVSENLHVYCLRKTKTSKKRNLEQFLFPLFRKTFSWQNLSQAYQDQAGKTINSISQAIKLFSHLSLSSVKHWHCLQLRAKCLSHPINTWVTQSFKTLRENIWNLELGNFLLCKHGCYSICQLRRLNYAFADWGFLISPWQRKFSIFKSTRFSRNKTKTKQKWAKRRVAGIEKNL